MKTCFKCGVPKPRSEFYAHPKMADGLVGKCKECNKNDVRERYAVTREQRAAYDKKREQDPERKINKQRYMRKHRDEHPDKYAARGAVNNAIRDGRLVRQPCLLCGDKKTQAHHEDYSKPLDVEWLCFKCHREHRHQQTTVTQSAVSQSDG